MKKLWRKLFPVRTVYVTQFDKPDFNVSKDKSELWPGTSKAHEQSQEYFSWLYARLAELEVLYHKKPDDLTKEGMEAYATEQYGIINRINEIKWAIKLPSYATAMMNLKKAPKAPIDENENTNW